MNCIQLKCETCQIAIYGAERDDAAVQKVFESKHSYKIGCGVTKTTYLFPDGSSIDPNLAALHRDGVSSVMRLDDLCAEPIERDARAVSKLLEHWSAADQARLLREQQESHWRSVPPTNFVYPSGSWAIDQVNAKKCERCGGTNGTRFRQEIGERGMMVCLTCEPHTLGERLDCDKSTSSEIRGVVTKALDELKTYRGERLHNDLAWALFRTDEDAMRIVRDVGRERQCNRRTAERLVWAVEVQLRERILKRAQDMKLWLMRSAHRENVCRWGFHHGQMTDGEERCTHCRGGKQ